MAPMTAVATAVVARPPVFVEKKVDFRNSKQPWGVAVYVGDIPPHVPDEILGRCLECFGRTQVPDIGPHLGPCLNPYQAPI